MRVIPPHNPLLRIFLVLDLINMFPGILRERHIRPRLRRIQSRNTRGNTQAVAVFFSDQHSANFRLAVRTRVLPDLAEHFTLNRHSRLSLIRFPFTHFSHAYESSSPVRHSEGGLARGISAATAYNSSPNTALLSPAIKYAFSFSA